MAQKLGASTRKRSIGAGSRAPFSLEGANKMKFRIGDSAVHVILTGEGLDTEGLKALIVDLQDGEDVLIEQPNEDEIAPNEFPITVQVVSANPGRRYFAVSTAPEAPDETNISILETPILFVT